MYGLRDVRGFVVEGASRHALLAPIMASRVNRRAWYALFSLLCVHDSSVYFRLHTGFREVEGGEGGCLELCIRRQFWIVCEVSWIECFRCGTWFCDGVALLHAKSALVLSVAVLICAS
jgi:hypothetical protein